MSTAWHNHHSTRRVPSNLYTSSGIYKDELARIFRGASWNYVGLSSEVAKPGDYVQSYVGNTPVILVRDSGGTLRVFVNRCTHRGAKICHSQRGSAKKLLCPYHRWSFSLEGDLVGIPYRQGIRGKGGMSSDFKPEEHGLEYLNVTERHGVVFASFSFDMEPIANYLGKNIIHYFDRVCDGRELKVIGKMQHKVYCNWKLQIENVKDPFHAALLHSFFRTFGIWRADQEVNVQVCEKGRSSVLASTATFKSDYADRITANEPVSSLCDKRLIDYQQEYERSTGAIMTIWPNLIVLQQLNNLAMRHVIPDGPNSCIKSWTFFGYESDSDELLQKRLYQANLLGPCGLVTIDDNEILAVTQEGAEGSPDSNILLEAGKGESCEEGMMTESAIRGFYKYYKDVMHVNGIRS